MAIPHQAGAAAALAAALVLAAAGTGARAPVVASADAAAATVTVNARAGLATVPATGLQQMAGGWNGTWSQSGVSVRVTNADFDQKLAAGGGTVCTSI